MNAKNNDMGAFIKTYCCGGSYATAAGTGDNTAVTGQTIDILGYDSGKVLITYQTTLTEAKTLAIAAEYQEGSGSNTWDTAVALQASTVEETGGTGGGTYYGTCEFDLNLMNKKRYLRINFTPNLSHSGTDTSICTATLLLGGADSNPCTASS